MVSRRTNRHLAQKRGRRGAAFFLPMGIVSRKEGMCKPRRRLQDTGQNVCSRDSPEFPSSKREKVLVTPAGPGSAALLTQAWRLRAQG